MAKGIREKIKLVSSAGTGHFYTTTKNKRTKPEKLELNLYHNVTFNFSQQILALINHAFPNIHQFYYLMLVLHYKKDVQET